jgi:hypothetical protein
MAGGVSRNRSALHASGNGCPFFTNAKAFEQSSFCHDAGLARGSNLPCPEPRDRAAHDGLRFPRAALSAEMRPTPGTYQAQGEIDKCQEDVNRYVNSVAAYRISVRETNGTLQRWKCGVAAKALCR